MYQAHDPVAMSEDREPNTFEALIRAGSKQGKRTVVEYVHSILPHLRRCRSSMTDQSRHRAFAHNIWGLCIPHNTLWAVCQPAKMVGTLLKS